MPWIIKGEWAAPLADACQYKWCNQTLCQVNGSVRRLGVLDGEFIIDLEGRAVERAPRQGSFVPKGIIPTETDYCWLTT